MHAGWGAGLVKGLSLGSLGGDLAFAVGSSMPVSVGLFGCEGHFRKEWAAVSKRDQRRRQEWW